MQNWFDSNQKPTISLCTLLSFVTAIRMLPQINQKKWFSLVTERYNSFVFLVIFCLAIEFGKKE